MDNKDLMNNLAVLKEVRALAAKRSQLIEDSKDKISKLKNEIEKLSADQRKMILGLLNVKKIFSKKKTEEEIEQMLLETNLKLSNEQNKLALLESSSVKDNLSLEKICHEMNVIRDHSERQLKELEQETIALYNSYLDKKRMYSEELNKINSSILSTNNYLDQIFNDDVFYRDGSYWDKKTGVRVNRQRPGIHTIVGNNKLYKKEG